MLRKGARLTVLCAAGILAVLVLSAAPYFATLRGATPQQQQAAADAKKTVHIIRAPLRTVEDPNPSFSSVAVDVARNEIALEDENLDQIVVYGRLDNTPAQAALTEPKRVIGGSK